MAALPPLLWTPVVGRGLFASSCCRDNVHLLWFPIPAASLWGSAVTRRPCPGALGQEPTVYPRPSRAFVQQHVQTCAVEQRLPCLPALPLGHRQDPSSRKGRALREGWGPPGVALHPYPGPHTWAGWALQADLCAPPCPNDKNLLGTYVQKPPATEARSMAAKAPHESPVRPQ